MDRFSSLRELHISGNLDIDLFHVLNKPTLTSATYCQRILTNEEMKDLTSKLEQTIRGVSQDGAFAYVPLLDDLSIYWKWKDDPEMEIPLYCRLLDACKHRLSRLLVFVYDGEEEWYEDEVSSRWHFSFIVLEY